MQPLSNRRRLINSLLLFQLSLSSQATLKLAHYSKQPHRQPELWAPARSELASSRATGLELRQGHGKLAARRSIDCPAFAL